MKKFQRIVVILLALSLVLGLAAAALAADEERPVILTVCRGTGDETALELTVEAAEKALLRAYPRCEIRRAFLSEEAAEATGTDTLQEALERLSAQGVTDVTLAPLMLTEGADYRAMAETAAEWEGKFDSMRLGLPLTTEQDPMVLALESELRRWERQRTAVVFVAPAEEDAAALEALQQALRRNGHSRCFVGAGEETETVMGELPDREITGVLLVPLDYTPDENTTDTLALWQKSMEEAGYTAETVTQGLGEYGRVRELVISGVKKARSLADTLAALPEAEETESLAPAEEETPAEPEETEPEAVEPEEEEIPDEPEETEPETAALAEEEIFDEPAEAEPETVEPAEEELPDEPVEAELEAYAPEEEELFPDPEEEELPAKGEEAEQAPAPEEAEPSEEPEESEPAAPAEEARTAPLVAGTYPVRVLSSSSRFTVKSAQLSVAGGKMIAVLTLEGRRYGEMYVGTAAQALQAEEEELIPFQWSGQGDMTFTVPVEALDTELVFAVWSIRRGCWLDRLLIVDSASLPASAFAK